MPAARSPCSARGVSSWTDRTSTSNRRTRSSTIAGGTSPRRRLTVAIRRRGPPDTGEGVPRRLSTDAARTAPDAAASSPAGRDRAPTAAARGSTDVAAAYGVNDIAGTSGKPRSVPVPRSTAQVTHGRVDTSAAGRRRFPAATIGVTVSSPDAISPVGG